MKNGSTVTTTSMCTVLHFFSLRSTILAAVGCLTEVIGILHYRRMQMVMESVQQLTRRLPCLYPNLPQALAHPSYLKVRGCSRDGIPRALNPKTPNPKRASLPKRSHLQAHIEARIDKMCEGSEENHVSVQNLLSSVASETPASSMARPQNLLGLSRKYRNRILHNILPYSLLRSSNL